MRELCLRLCHVTNESARISVGEVWLIMLMIILGSLYALVVVHISSILAETRRWPVPGGEAGGQDGSEAVRGAGGGWRRTCDALPSMQLPASACRAAAHVDLRRFVIKCPAAA